MTVQIALKPLISEIRGLSPEQARSLAKAFSYEEINYYYERQGWNTRKYLLKAAGTCYQLPTGLIPKLVSLIKTPVQLTQACPVWKKDPGCAYFSQASFTLRPYQVKAAMSLMQQKDGRLGGILQIATGGGKTRIVAKVVQLMQVPTLYVVHTRELLHQTRNVLHELLQIPIGQIGDGAADIQPITVATYQSLTKQPSMTVKAFMMRTAQLIIYDEAHHVSCTTLQAISQQTHAAVSTIGLSASPWRDDGLDLLIEAVCGPVRFTISASDLIKMGYLVQPVVKIHFLNAPQDKTPEHRSDDQNTRYWAWISAAEERNRYIAQLAQAHPHEAVLILVKQIDHGDALAALIPGAEFLDGSKSTRRRKEILERVRTGKTRVLIATSLADEGLDLPILSVLILAGAGSSSTRALQRLGRVLRTHPGKTTATIYDLVDAHASFRRQFQDRQQIYRTEPSFILEKSEITIYY